MPIPEFASHGALPPFVSGNPTQPDARSPYPTTMAEVVERFCTTGQRAKLLLGLNAYRKHLHAGGFISGHQWIDGSFVENIEVRQGRSPNDIDLVTLYNRPLKYQGDDAGWRSDYQAVLRGKYFEPKAMKPNYGCDTYDVDLDAGPRAVLRGSTYWFGLFSDMRGSIGKKGIVEIALAIDPMEFAATEQAIRGKFDV